MTRAAEIFGDVYDSPARLPQATDLYEDKRGIALGTLRGAETQNDTGVAQIAYWELGLIDLVLAAAEGVSPYRGGEHESYAAFYRLTPDTIAYARERANETCDIILKLHYLEYIQLQSEQKGREWIERQREILTAYKEYADGCRAAASLDHEGFVGLYIERALVAIGRLLIRRGVLGGSEAEGWAQWITRLAEDSRSFPTGERDDEEQQRHRWSWAYLANLIQLPAASVNAEQRERAFSLLADAAAYYRSTPLNDDFEHGVAEVEMSLRKHWGEEGTHEQLIRRQFEATVRRAEFHKGTGSGMLTAHFFREARRLIDQHRQYFTSGDVENLQLAERQALESAVHDHEFAETRVSMNMPKEIMDYTRDTPETTIAALLERVRASVPDREELKRDVSATHEDAPLSALLRRTVVSGGRVVGETIDESGNEALDVEMRANHLVRLLGQAVVITVTNASRSTTLTAQHLIDPLGPLRLDAGTIAILLRGCERLIEQDFVSATHILVTHIEDVLRQHLQSIGVDTTEFRRDVGDGTSRTDDATLGALLRKLLPDGRTVREYFGADLWDLVDSVLNSQTGLNLRNDFAHGLARERHCSPEVAGIGLSLLYLLADVASGAGPPGRELA